MLECVHSRPRLVWTCPVIGCLALNSSVYVPSNPLWDAFSPLRAQMYTRLVAKLHRRMHGATTTARQQAEAHNVYCDSKLGPTSRHTGGGIAAVAAQPQVEPRRQQQTAS